MDNNKPLIITPLGRLLTTTSMENLVAFLTAIGVRWSISGNYKCDKGEYGHHVCRIFIQEKRNGVTETLREYVSTSGRTPKMALATALANFLINEQHDYHDYKQLMVDYSKDEAFL